MIIFLMLHLGPLDPIFGYEIDMRSLGPTEDAAGEKNLWWAHCLRFGEKAEVIRKTNPGPLLIFWGTLTHIKRTEAFRRGFFPPQQTQRWCLSFVLHFCSSYAVHCFRTSALNNRDSETNKMVRRTTKRATKYYTLEIQKLFFFFLSAKA